MSRPEDSSSKSDRRDRKKDKKERKKDRRDSKDETHEERKIRKKKREAEVLVSEEHLEDVKRMRTWSKDRGVEGTEESPAKRRRTRSMDVAEEKEVTRPDDLTPDEWRKEHNITVRGHGGAARTESELPEPFMRFSDAPYHDRIQQGFERAGFDAPTPIQAQAWPIALQNKDMICIAKTGSGKTCGFLLPAYQQYLTKMNNVRIQGFVKPVLLVLAPTRELSVQIMEEAQRFGRPLGIRSVCCYGGSSKGPQIGALERGVEVVIATPGRLNDLLEMRKADLSNIQYLVLDEADRMLDMGTAYLCDFFMILTSKRLHLVIAHVARSPPPFSTYRLRTANPVHSQTRTGREPPDDAVLGDVAARDPGVGARVFARPDPDQRRRGQPFGREQGYNPVGRDVFRRREIR